MIGYLGRGHSVRVTLTARQRSLKDNADAICTMLLERVRELLFFPFSSTATASLPCATSNDTPMPCPRLS